MSTEAQSVPGPGNDDTMSVAVGAVVGGKPVNLPRQVGPVRLIREIGRGGMGVVFLGRHEMLARDVAVKFLLHAVAQKDDPRFSSFLEGARAAAAISHPGLVTIHHADLVDGIPYLVQRFIDGPTLADLLQANGAMDPALATAIMFEVTEAVAHLHDNGVVHRDVKPSNILLNAEGAVFVTDFGLAIQREPTAGRGKKTLVAGTPCYMAPEAFEGHVSPRTDVYALGMTLYEMLTGNRPSVSASRSDAVSFSAKALSRIGEAADCAALEDLVRRAVNPDPMFRFKTARHLANALATEHGVKTDTAHKLAVRRIVAGLEPTSPTSRTPKDRPTDGSYFDELTDKAKAKRQRKQLAGNAGQPGSPGETDVHLAVLEEMVSVPRRGWNGTDEACACGNQVISDRCGICLSTNWRSAREHKVYGKQLCKRCYYDMANRRHFAFLIDFVLIGAVIVGAVEFALTGEVRQEPSTTAAVFAFAVAMGMRDGFCGRSPGKLILGLRVLSNRTMTPAGMQQSILRNLPIMGIITLDAMELKIISATSLFEPRFATNIVVMLAILSSTLYLIMAYRLQRGPRWGDGLADTRVVLARSRRLAPYRKLLTCEKCGFDLRATTVIACTECAQAIPQSTLSLMRNARSR